MIKKSTLIFIFILTVIALVAYPRSTAQPQPLEVYCLAETIYFESRGEPYLGQVAVGHVVKNRARRSGESICSTVRKPAQFSVADKFGSRKHEQDKWRQAQAVATNILENKISDPTNGAEWFHAVYVQPHWAKSKNLVLEVGNHLFYSYDSTK